MKTKTKLIIIFVLMFAMFNPYSLKLITNSLNKVVENDGAIFSKDDFSDVKSKGDLISESEADKLKNSKLTGEDYQFDSNYYPYYFMLSDNEKKLYKQIYAHMNSVIDSFVPSVDVNVSEVKKTFEALYNDHPELFWVDTTYSYKYTSSNKCVQINLSYNETVNDLQKNKQLFDNEVNKIIKGASKLKSDYAKEKYVHDTLVTTIKYDKNASMNQSAYSALVNKKTICAGYARAFQYILIKLNIPTYYVVGVSTVNHAWNMVKLDDGYYNVDLTWDNSDLTRYKYFNKTDNDFLPTHTRTGLSLNLPKCNAYNYRNLTNSNVNRHTKPSNVTSNIISNTTTNNNVTSNVVIPKEVVKEEKIESVEEIQPVENEEITDDNDEVIEDNSEVEETIDNRG